jgi:hypothetical protein
MLTRQSIGKTAIKLPFLAVSRRNGKRTEPFESPKLARHSIVFTTLAAAGRYLKKRDENDLELNLIFRQSVESYVDNLAAGGFHGVCVNEDDGDKASLAELRSLNGS